MSHVSPKDLCRERRFLRDPFHPVSQFHPRGMSRNTSRVLWGSGVHTGGVRGRHSVRRHVGGEEGPSDGDGLWHVDVGVPVVVHVVTLLGVVGHRLCPGVQERPVRRLCLDIPSTAV